MCLKSTSWRTGVRSYLAIACVAMEAVCDLLGPTIMARILDEGVRAMNLNRVGFWGLIMLLVTAAGAVFALVRNALSSGSPSRWARS